MDRYEEALERARAGKPIDEVFPELKESEDERIRKMLVEQMKRWKKCAEDNNVEQDVEDASAAIAYLEKQKEQQPAEWSKENEKWIDRACMLLNELNDLSHLTLAKIPSNVDEIIAHLKSLRPQPHWKPSKAQMEELLNALIPGKDFDCDILAELYEQLKKI